MHCKYFPKNEKTKILLNDYIRKNGQVYDIFINIENDVIEAETLQGLMSNPKIKINRSFYQYPVRFPFSNFNLNSGTMFEGWEATSFYEKFYYDGNYINRLEVPKQTLSLNDYVLLVEKNLEDFFSNFFKENKTFVLSYSRGIDSLLLLSYVMKYGMLKNCFIVNIDFPGIDHNFSLDLNVEKNLGLDINKIEFNKKNLLSYINQSDPLKFYSMQDYFLVDSFKDINILSGYDGNSVLLHKWEWIHRIGRGSFSTVKNFYTTSVLDWINYIIPRDIDNDMITIVPPFSRHWNNPELKNLISPISNIQLMELLPFIKIKDIDPIIIAEAAVPKKIIQKNVGSALDELIINENNNFENFWRDYHVDHNDIDPKELKFKISKRVVPAINYSKRELEAQIQNNKINISRLLSVKFNNALSHE